MTAEEGIKGEMERDESFLLQLWEGMSSFSEAGREGKRSEPVKGWKSCLSLYF